jgi:hypothetical protein
MSGVMTAREMRIENSGYAVCIKLSHVELDRMFTNIFPIRMVIRVFRGVARRRSVREPVRGECLLRYVMSLLDSENRDVSLQENNPDRNIKTASQMRKAVICDVDVYVS